MPARIGGSCSRAAPLRLLPHRSSSYADIDRRTVSMATPDAQLRFDACRRITVLYLLVRCLVALLHCCHQQRATASQPLPTTEAAAAGIDAAELTPEVLDHIAGTTACMRVFAGACVLVLGDPTHADPT